MSREGTEPRYSIAGRSVTVGPIRVHDAQHCNMHNKRSLRVGVVPEYCLVSCLVAMNVYFIALYHFVH